MEGFEEPKYYSKDEVFSIVRGKSLEDPEVNTVVQKWLLQREGETRAENTSRANIVLEVDRMELYQAMGDEVSARQCAEDAYTMAWNEGQYDILEHLEQKFPDINT